jgi:hypothetical protein
MTPTARISFSEAEWRHFLVSKRPRPNLLILCPSGDIESVVTRLVVSCTGPVHLCRLPGELSFPGESAEPAGTLLIWDVAQLTRFQQLTLHDWISRRPWSTQVICLTSTPLLPLVEDGQFLEGLFYRINVVSLIANLESNRPARPSPVGSLLNAS